MTELPNQIIDSVPGMPAADSSTLAAASHGNPIPVDGFRGDPSRVLGHPSNPTSEAVLAYADQLNTQSNEAQSTPWSKPTIRYAGQLAVEKPQIKK